MNCFLQAVPFPPRLNVCPQFGEFLLVDASFFLLVGEDMGPREVLRVALRGSGAAQLRISTHMRACKMEARACCFFRTKKKGTSSLHNLKLQHRMWNFGLTCTLLIRNITISVWLQWLLYSLCLFFAYIYPFKQNHVVKSSMPSLQNCMCSVPDSHVGLRRPTDSANVAAYEIPNV